MQVAAKEAARNKAAEEEAEYARSQRSIGLAMQAQVRLLPLPLLVLGRAGKGAGAPGGGGGRHAARPPPPRSSRPAAAAACRCGLQAQRAEAFRKARAAEAAGVLKTQMAEKTTRTAAMNAVYAGQISPAYFSQFGSSHR